MFIGLTVLLNTVSLIANVVSVFTVALLENVYHGTHSTEMIIRAALTVVTVIAVRAKSPTPSARTSYLSAANVKKVLRRTYTEAFAPWHFLQ